jgi:hypothetical protein
MAELHHRMKEEEAQCGVKGCAQTAVRSLPTKKVAGNVKAGLKGEEARRTPLCKEHYREYKRATKDERITDSLGWQR